MTTTTKKAYWLNGTAYCADCVECESPCLGEDEIARATREEGIGRCGCCGDAFLVLVGEWGYTDSRGSGNWYAKPEDAAAVQAAYDAADSNDQSPDCDAEIIAAGGIFVAE